MRISLLKFIEDGLASMYSIQEIPAHISIAESCFEYLLQFRNPNSLTSQTFENFPLARYAAQDWTCHADGFEDIQTEREYSQIDSPI